MRTLFVHRNIPGQFRYLIARLTADRRNEVIAIGEPNRQPDLARTIRYASPRLPPGLPSILRPFVESLARGESVAAEAVRLKNSGFTPDVIVAHGSWGEALFLKDVWSDARLFLYADFFFSPQCEALNFDPEFQEDELAARRRHRATNAALLGSLSAADRIWVATRWQAEQFPREYRDRMFIMHEGVPTEDIDADADAVLTLGRDELRLGAASEVVTFVSRGLEPMRGFHIFMRSLPEILARRPEAHVVIVGGDAPAYGPFPPDNTSWRRRLLEEVGPRLDLSRVHFLGRVSRRDFLNILRVSSVHVYLTCPFVLSWSLLEAMAARCLVVASDTSPVREVVEAGRNGLLVDFLDVRGLAAAVVDALARPAHFGALRRAARQTIVDRFDLNGVCLPRQLDVLASLCRPAPVRSANLIHPRVNN